jgi:hypothetical protein
VVKVGEKITAKAGPATEACGGAASTVSWEWNYPFFDGLERLSVSSCPENSTSCVLLATSATGTPGHRYVEGCINGSSPFGGWTSCDYYAVEGCGSAAHAADTSSGAQCCIAQPNIAETARVTRKGQEVDVRVRATKLGPEKTCGRATLSSNRGAVFAIHRTGSSEVGTARLSGARSCFANIAADVRVAKGGSAKTTADVQDGTPSIETSRAHRTASGAISVTANLRDLRAEQACGEVKIDAEVAHGSRTPHSVQVAVLRDFRGTSATARARLNRSYACTTATRLTATQGDLGATARAVRVSGSAPVQCATRAP